MSQKLLCLSYLTLVLLVGCDASHTKTAPPSKEELNAAFTRALVTLNEKTNSQLTEIEIDWIEAVPESCYPHLDYFAQQVLWAAIYHEDIIKKKKRVSINCDAADFYEK